MGKLIWGADQEGGGPYVYPRDDAPSQVTGFEVELAGLLANYLKVRAEFFQGDWSKMPELLATRKVHIVMNGYEWTPVRAEQMEATIPYYVYGLQLLGRAADHSLNGWDDLRRPRPAGGKWKVGILTGSAAEAEIRKLGDTIVGISYDGNTDSMREVETGKIDATVQDTPIASFYRPRFPALRPVGDPVGEGHYVIYARKGETSLVAALNEALIVLIRNGELERLYRKYGIWDQAQNRLSTIADAGKFYGFAAAARAEMRGGILPGAEQVHVRTRARGWRVVRDYAGILIESAGMTAILSVLSFPLAITLGMLIAVGRLYGPAWIRSPLGVYVEFLRGTPLLLQLYFIFFFLPEVGIDVPAFGTAILGLAINYSAYESEIYRAGLQAIPAGQMEAALALGMSRFLALRRIIVPQAFRIVIPPVMNDFIALFKDTSVCSVITIVELTKRFSVLSQSTQATVELMIMTAALYLLMSYPLTLLSANVEKRLGKEQPA